MLWISFFSIIPKKYIKVKKVSISASLIEIFIQKE